MGNIAAFVSLASEWDRSQIRRVSLKKDSLERDFFDGFCNGCLLIGQDATDSDVPVAKSLQFLIGFEASALCMENTPEIQVSAIFQYIDYQLC